jgi:hypothetical protein
MVNVIMAPKNRIMNANGFSIMRHPIAPNVEQIDVIPQMFDVMFLIVQSCLVVV